MAGGDFVNANGVRTYYEAHGDGPPLLLLHGGLCPVESFAAQTAALSERFRVWLPERRGHGRTPDTEDPYSYAQMADDTRAFTDALAIESADVVGFSDGANVGLLLAIGDPRRVRRLVAISGNFDPGGVLSADEVPPRGRQDEASDGLAQAYAQLSPDGADHFQVVVRKLERVWAEEPRITADELGSIRARTLVMAGDVDMIRLEHTVELYRAVPDARLCIVPDAGHDLIESKAQLVNAVLLDFLA